MKSPEFSTNQEPSLDDQVEELLEKARDVLPADLLEKYEEQYENAETDEEVKELISQIKKVIEYRENNSGPKLPKIEDEFISEKCSEEELEDIKKQMEKLKAKIEKGEMPFLGEGRVAKVFSGWEGSDFCFKVIKADEEAINIYKGENDIKREMELMEEVENKVNVEGVRLPQPYYYQGNDEMHYIAMESLDAITLEGAMNKPSNLPDNFDQEKFFSSLEEFVEELNKNKIFHRDLHEGNIMIDKNDGTCYVIDFGMAVHHFDEEKAFSKIDERTGNMIKTASDKQKVADHKIKLLNILNP